MAKLNTYVCLLIYLFFVLNTISSFWFFKRRRSCRATDCRVSSWSQWSQCTESCGLFGIKTRTRYVTASATCGGSCKALKEEVSCNLICCPKMCEFVPTAWSSCTGCGTNGTRTRSFVIVKKEECGGSCSVPKPEKQTCDTGRYASLFFLFLFEFVYCV